MWKDVRKALLDATLLIRSKNFHYKTVKEAIGHNCNYGCEAKPVDGEDCARRLIQPRGGEIVEINLESRPGVIRCQVLQRFG